MPVKCSAYNMSKHRLIVEDEYEFLAYGISCHLKDFRVAWNLNRLFRFDLIRHNLDLPDREGTTHSYSKYVYHDSDNHLRYFLVSNFSEDITLIKTLKEYDYFLLIEGYIDIFDEERFLDQLQALESLQMVAEVNPEDLRKFQYAIFED